MRKRPTIDHIVLTILDVQRSKQFYVRVFGPPDFEDTESSMYEMGETRLFISAAYHPLSLPDRFDPDRVGLNHVAFGVSSLKELQEIEKHLNREKIQHSGIHIDQHSSQEKIWLDDPDGIRLEFFLRGKA